MSCPKEVCSRRSKPLGQEYFGHFRYELQEVGEALPAVFRFARSGDVPSGDLEGSVQGRGAVTGVVMGSF